MHIANTTIPSAEPDPTRVAAHPAAAVIGQIDRYRALWFCVVGGFLALSFNGQWIIGPDSAAYRQIGHQLATTGRYFFRDAVPGLTEYHNKQGTLFPGLPVALAAIEKIFGPSTLAPLLAMQALAVLTLVLTYRLMLYRLDRWAAVCVVVGVGTNPKFLQLTNEILGDVPFLLGVVMALLGCEWALKPKSPWKARGTFSVGLPAGAVLVFAGLILASVMRITIWLLDASLLAACGWGLVAGRTGLMPAADRVESPARVHAVSATLLIVLGLSVALFVTCLDIRAKQTKGIASGGYESRVAGKIAGNKFLPEIPGNLAELLEHALPMSFLGYRAGVGLIPVGRGHSLGVGAAFSIVLVLAGVALARRNVLWGSLVAISVIVLGVMGPVPRYFLMILPLLLAGWGLLVAGVAGRFSTPRRSAFVMRLGLGFVLSLNFAASATFILTQRGYTMPFDERGHWVGIRHVGFLRAYHYGHWAGIYDLAAMVHREVGPAEKILGPEPTILTYLSGRQVYPPHKDLMKLGAGTIFKRALFPVGAGRQSFDEYDVPLAEFVEAGTIREGRADAGPVAGYRLSALEVRPEGSK